MIPTLLSLPLPPLLLLHLLANGQRYDVDDTIATLVNRRRAQLFSAADSCVSTLGTSLGEEFLACVLSALEEHSVNTTQLVGAADEEKGELVEDPFPVPPYTLHPLTVKWTGNEVDEANHGLLLLDLLRNYTCGLLQDGGSPIIDTKSWTYDEKEVLEAIHEKTCPADFELTGTEYGQYTEVGGYLPRGDDVGTEQMGVDEAKKHCDDMPVCQGFTFQDIDGDTKQVFFKGTATVNEVQMDGGWRSYVRKQLPARCLTDSAEEEEEQVKVEIDYAPPHKYTIKILRHEPLVTIIPDFATDAECEMLIEAGGSDESMGRAYETGGPSSYRRSYSSNIDVDYEDPSSEITRFAERMFAFVRNVTDYEVYGPGQEPINAVLYKDVGDEYRPHCDGPCNGGTYPYGLRVATTILYCETPDGDGAEGSGQTSFTRSGLMVSPRKRDLLLFVYKYANGTMDNGFTEHSGCPILGGRKWIATQWYREGVDYDHPWHTFRHG